MHHFIFPSQDTWISSGSNLITGESFKDQNFGRDQILEVKKEFFNNSFDHFTRALVNFAGTEFTELSKSVADGTISSDAKYYLRLYEAEGNAEMTEEYTLELLEDTIKTAKAKGDVTNLMRAVDNLQDMHGMKDKHLVKTVEQIEATSNTKLIDELRETEDKLVATKTTTKEEN